MLHTLRAKELMGMDEVETLNSQQRKVMDDFQSFRSKMPSFQDRIARDHDDDLTELSYWLITFMLSIITVSRKGIDDERAHGMFLRNARST